MKLLHTHQNVGYKETRPTYNLFNFKEQHHEF